MSTGSNSLEKLERQVREACGDLGRRLRHGEPCRAEEYFERIPTTDCHSDSVLELIYTEYVVREELGEAVTPDEWYVRFPKWSEDLKQMFDVHRQFSSIDTRSSASIGRNSTSLTSPKARVVDLTDWTSGRIVGGYQLVDEIGRGGMGVVFRARQLKLNRDVALKMVLSGEFASPSELARFQTEAESAARLQHPNIVQVFEVSAHDRHPFLSMELVDGGNLESQLKAQRMAPRDAARLLQTISIAVHFAHQNGVIHRDIKPSNVLMTSTGEPKVADFGLAKQLLDGHAENTRSGAIIGTPSYLPPELVGRGNATVGATSDVYSLGVMFFEMLTGRLPFVAESPLELLKSIVNEDPPAPSKINTRVPKDLETICLKCLSKESSRRYQSAAELAHDLQRFLLREPIRARPIGITERLVKWTRRRPLAATFIGFLLASLTAVSMLLWMAEYRGNQAKMAAIRADKLRQTAELAHQRSERSLYFRRIGQAHAEWQANMVNRASALLDECPLEMRHFEWKYLKSLCDSDLHTMRGHTESVQSLAVSPDGNIIASGSGEWGVPKPGEIILWDAQTGKQLVVIHGHDGPIMSLAFSPDGQTLASASASFGRVKPPGVKVWNLEGKLLYSLPAPVNQAYAIKFNLGGNLLAVGGLDNVFLWNLATGKVQQKLTGHQGLVLDVAFDPTGKSVATAGRDGSARVYNLESGMETQVFSGFGDLRNVSYSPDGSTLAFTNYGGNLRLWNVTKPPEELDRFTYPIGAISGLAFSPEGRRIGLSGDDGSVLIVDAKTGAELKRIRTHDGNVSNLQFGDDGRTLVTSGVDGLVKVWDARTNWDPNRIDTRKSAQTTTFRHIVHTPNRQHVLLPNGFSKANPGLGEKVLLVFDLEKRSADKVLSGHKGHLTDVAVTPDGDRYLTSSVDGTVRVWNAATGKEESQWAHPSEVESVCCDSTGKQAATGCTDGIVRLWNLETGKLKQEWQAHQGRIARVAFSPNEERLATVGQDGFCIWNTEIAEQRLILSDYSAPCTSLAYSRSGKWIATCGEDRCVKLWRASSGELIHTMRGHTRTITDIAFSPDESRLVSSSTDCTIKLWDVDSGEEALTLRDRMSVHSVQFNPAGNQILSVTNAILTFWDAEPIKSPIPEQKFQAINNSWHSQRAKALRLAGQEFASQFHYERLANTEVESNAEYLRRAGARAQMKQWKLAAADFRAVIEKGSTNRATLASYGLCQLEAGSIDEYTRICRQLVDSIDEKTKPFEINNSVWLSVLNRSSTQDFEGLVVLLQGAYSRADAAQKKGMDNTIGAAFYRAGRYDEARDSLNRSLQDSNFASADDWILLSMVEAKLNNLGKAKEWLEKFYNWRSAANDSGASELAATLLWDTRSAQDLLAKEARQLIVDAGGAR